jgi:hypothetical protein
MRKRFQLENLKGRDHLEDIGVDGRWEDNIRVDLREMWWEVVDCMCLA